EILLGDAPQAHEALDLFLATAGWRHFVRAEGREEIALALAKDEQPRGEAVTTAAVFSRNNADAVKTRATQDLARRDALLRADFVADRAALQEERNQRLVALGTALETLAEYERQPDEYLRLGLGLLAVLLVAAGVVALL